MLKCVKAKLPAFLTILSYRLLAICIHVFFTISIITQCLILYIWDPPHLLWSSSNESALKSEAEPERQWEDKRRSRARGRHWWYVYCVNYCTFSDSMMLTLISPQPLRWDEGKRASEQKKKKTEKVLSGTQMTVIRSTVMHLDNCMSTETSKSVDA